MVPGQESSWCLDATLHIAPCATPAPPSQTWAYDHATGLVHTAGGCLSSQPPAGPTAPTRVTVGVRLGGDISPDASSPPGVVRAYNTNWYDWGYYFSLDLSGVFELARGSTVVATGPAPSGVHLHTWYNISLTVRGALVTAAVDGAELASWTDPAPTQLARGWVGLGSGWHQAQFDAFSMTRL